MMTKAKLFSEKELLKHFPKDIDSMVYQSCMKDSSLFYQYKINKSELLRGVRSAMKAAFELGKQVGECNDTQEKENYQETKPNS